MKKLIRQALAFLLCAALLCPAVYAAETAANIQLTKTTGTVTVTKSNGKAVSIRADMRLYNGYNVTTAEKSYAWINLDSTKLMKLDASSSVEVRKNGSKLEVNVKSGSVSFDVSEKLGSGESLNVSTSTMAVGIRGTCGWVSVNDQWVSEVCILEGSSQCVVMDPVTNQIKSALLVGGDVAQCVVYPQDKAGDKCDILMEQQTTEGIPGFVLTELVQNVKLCDRILEDSGLDVLADLAKTAGGDPSGRTPDGKSASPEVLGQAERVRSGEEAETAQKLEEIRKAEESQEHNVSKDPVWEQGEQPGSSGGGSGGGTSTPPAPVTYTVTLDANGGTFSGESKVTLSTVAGGKLTTLPTPTREAYTFGGWYKEAACTTPWDSDTDTVTGNVTLYAKWTLNQYTVTFNSRGGSDVTGTQVNHGSKVTQPADPTKINYTFGGWYKEAEFTNEWDFAADTVTGNVTLYAKWLGVYSVTFDPNGGTLSDESQGTIDTSTDGKLSNLPASTRIANTGGTATYTFEGWYTAAAGGSEVDETRVFTENTTVYAHWTAGPGWDWEQNGTDLRIFGTGRMNVYFVPWDTDITSAVIEDGVTSIGMSMFDRCSSLESITIPESVTFIGEGEFGYCENLTSVTYNGTVEQWWKILVDMGSTKFLISDFSSYAGEFLSEIGLNRNATIKCKDGEITSTTTPLYTITFIANGGTLSGPSTAMTNTDGIVAFPTDLTAPVKTGGNTDAKYVLDGWYTSSEGGDKVEETKVFTKNIWLYAHWKLDSWDWEKTETALRIYGTGDMGTNSSNRVPWGTDITSVEIEKGVTSIGDYAFYDCSNLTGIIIPEGVTSIGSSAFSNCTGLTSISIPAGVTSIGYEAFNICSSLTSIEIPESVTSIGDRAFYYCEGLTSITIPGSVASIGNDVFSGCRGLTSVTIQEGVTGIGEVAFYECSGLTEITIPGSVTSIGFGAFYECTNLNNITFNGTQAQWSDINIDSDSGLSGKTVTFSNGSKGTINDDGSITLIP